MTSRYTNWGLEQLQHFRYTFKGQNGKSENPKNEQKNRGSIDFFFLRFYLFIGQRERTQVGREAGRERGGSRIPAEQRAQCGAQSPDPETMT